MAKNLLKEGYKPADISRALDISRSNCYISAQSLVNQKSEDFHIVKHIKAIAAQHPFWGYRRITAWLKHREGELINHKKVYRLMKEHKLLVPRKSHKANRTPQKGKPKPERPREWWGIDMTKFMLPRLGWCYLVIVLDWFNKKLVGYSIGLRSRSREWQEAIEMAVESECPYGSREEDINLMSDNGSQPTSLSFMKCMSTLGIKQAFTSYNNPKGNADTERVMRTIKEEFLWLEEFDSLEEVKMRLSYWIEVDYNKRYVHSALGYLSPEEFSEKWENSLREIDQAKTSEQKELDLLTSFA